MQKLEQLYEGKAKKVYSTDEQELLIVEYKYGAHIDITYEINHLVEDAPIPHQVMAAAQERRDGAMLRVLEFRCRNKRCPDCGRTVGRQAVQRS